MYYRDIDTRLDEPLVWFWLLAPCLLLRQTRLLFRSKTPRPQTNTPLSLAATRGREDTLRTLLG